MRRFVAVFKRDKHTPPPLVTDHAHSSASSSSGSTSLCLQTPDDDQHLPAAVERNASRKSWRSWLKGSSKKTQLASLPDWAPPSHDVENIRITPDPSFHEEPPDDPLQSFTVLVKNSLQLPSPPQAPFSHHSDVDYVFPKSVNRASLLPRAHSLATLTLKRHILERLQDEHHPFSQSELLSIAPLATRRITPVIPVNQPPHHFNETAPSKTTVVSSSCPGVGTWVSRPCFEDRYDLFIPEQDGTISRQPIVGSDLAVAALEFSEAIEAIADIDLTQLSSQVDVPSETVSTPPSSSDHSRNSPYMPAPSPLRNENLPPSPSVSVIPSVPPPVPIPTEIDSSVKRGVRFAEDGKDDIPLSYVLRKNKKREEKAKFLRAEQEKRILEEERTRHEEERRRRDVERAEWEKERKAWEKEKRVMDEERQHRKYAEEVAAARLRRESQRAGGVPSLKVSENNAFLVPSTGAGHFPTSASSSTSERNKPSAARRHSRPTYDDGVAPAYLPRREASEPNLPTRLSMNALTSSPITQLPRGSHSPNSSRPPSDNVERPPSPDSSSPLPGTRSPSIHSSQEVPSSSEDVKAAVAAAANRAKRHSFVASISTSRNNSNISLSGDRATSYPVWTGSNHSLNNMVPPVPMFPPIQMQMMPPYAMMDMPLLPPVPPFMLHQYSRPHGPPGSPGSGGGSPKGRLGGSVNSSKERLDSQNSSRERVNVIGGASRSGSVERGYVGERSDGESRSHPSRSASFPRPEAPRHTPSSPSQGSGLGSSHRVHHGHVKHPSSPGSSSRRASAPVSPPQSHGPTQRTRQGSHDVRPHPPPHAHSQPAIMPRPSSAKNLPPPSPWTGLPTQSGKLPNGNSNASGNNSRGNKTVPPRHMSYSGVRSEGVRQSNMRTDPPRQAKRQAVA